MNIFKQLDSLYAANEPPNSLGGGANGLSAQETRRGLPRARRDLRRVRRTLLRHRPPGAELASIACVDHQDPAALPAHTLRHVALALRFRALMGCRLSFHAVLRLLVATIAVNLAASPRRSARSSGSSRSAPPAIRSWSCLTYSSSPLRASSPSAS